MKIEIIKCLNDNYSYLIIDETNQNACVIDPSESAPIINFIKNKEGFLSNSTLNKLSTCDLKFISKKKGDFLVSSCV